VAGPTNRFDPDDTTRIGAALNSYLRKGPGIGLTASIRRLGGGLDTYVYEFEVAGDGGATEWDGRLVLRVYPDMAQAEKARREEAVQRFACESGFPAPRPLLLETDGSAIGLPFMIMKRCAGRVMLDRFKNPVEIPRMLSAMAGMHVRLHRLPVQDCPLPAEGSLVDRLLAAVHEQVGKPMPDEIRSALSRLEANAGLVRDEERVLCHNDFHPLNILIDGEDLCLIDWPDADIGDRHCDIARTTALFWLAPPLARSVVERLALRALRRRLISGYLNRYRRELPVDAERLRYWQALHALRAWVQVEALRSGSAPLGARGGAVDELPKGLVPALKRYVEERIRNLDTPLLR
jgi:aminoglycoside phosphotransferase (APT) family kinase protein